MDGKVLICLKGWEDVRSALSLVDLSRFGCILLNVIDAGPLGAREIALGGLAGRRIPPVERLRMSQAADDASRELLAEAGYKVAAAGGLVLSLEHRVGEPGVEIARVANDIAPDLIVLWAGEGNHSPKHPPPPPHREKPPVAPPPKALRHLSSMVHFVLTHARCPVLVLPGNEGQRFNPK